MCTQLTLAAGDRFDPLRVIERLDRAATTKVKYRRALVNYLETGGSLADANALARHAEALPTSRRTLLKAAVGHIAGAIADHAKGQATPVHVQDVQATLYRVEALQAVIRVERSKGQKAHTLLFQRSQGPAVRLWG